MPNSITPVRAHPRAVTIWRFVDFPPCNSGDACQAAATPATARMARKPDNSLSPCPHSRCEMTAIPVSVAAQGPGRTAAIQVAVTGRDRPSGRPRPIIPVSSIAWGSAAASRSKRDPAAVINPRAAGSSRLNCRPGLLRPKRTRAVSRTTGGNYREPESKQAESTRCSRQPDAAPANPGPEDGLLTSARRGHHNQR